jgi:hypothetical protein
MTLMTVWRMGPEGEGGGEMVIIGRSFGISWKIQVEKV